MGPLVGILLELVVQLLVDLHLDLFHQGLDGRIVDVLHHQVALGAVNGTEAVGDRAGSSGEDRHLPVGPGEGDAVGDIHTLGRFDAGGLDPLGPAEDHLRKVEGVHPYVQQSAAGQLRLDDPLLVGDSVAEVGGEKLRLPDDPGVQYVRQRLPHGLVAGPDGLGDEKSLLPCIAGDLLGLTGVDGKGLLTEDVLAAAKALRR